MTLYAAKTAVPVEKSRAEIERMLTRYAATRFASGWSERGAVLMFEAKGRRVRFDLPMPDPNDKRFTTMRTTRWTSKPRSKDVAQKAYEQECRARWRALCLVIKAKLEAVESGITTFEDEFLAHIVLPDGATFGQWAVDQLKAAYEGGKMPPMLPGVAS